MNLKQLLEKRAKVSDEITALADRCNDPDHDWSDDDEQEWNAANKRYESLTKQIELAQPADNRNVLPDGDVRDNDPAGN